MEKFLIKMLSIKVQFLFMLVFNLLNFFVVLIQCPTNFFWFSTLYYLRLNSYIKVFGSKFKDKYIIEYFDAQYGVLSMSKNYKSI